MRVFFRVCLLGVFSLSFRVRARVRFRTQMLYVFISFVVPLPLRSRIQFVAILSHTLAAIDGRGSESWRVSVGGVGVVSDPTHPPLRHYIATSCMLSRQGV